MEGLQNYTQIIENTSNIEWLISDSVYAKIDSFYTIPLPEQPTYAFIGVFNTDGDNTSDFVKVNSSQSSTIYFSSSGYGKITVNLTSSGITLSQSRTYFSSNSSIDYVAWKEKE